MQCFSGQSKHCSPLSVCNSFLDIMGLNCSIVFRCHPSFQVIENDGGINEDVKDPQKLRCVPVINA